MSIFNAVRHSQSWAVAKNMRSEVTVALTFGQEKNQNSSLKSANGLKRRRKPPNSFSEIWLDRFYKDFIHIFDFFF